MSKGRWPHNPELKPKPEDVDLDVTHALALMAIYPEVQHLYAEVSRAPLDSRGVANLEKMARLIVEMKKVDLGTDSPAPTNVLQIGSMEEARKLLDKAKGN